MPSFSSLTASTTHIKRNENKHLKQTDGDETGSRTTVMHMRLGKASHEVELGVDEQMTVSVYTKSGSLAEFAVFKKVADGAPWASLGSPTRVTNDRTGAGSEDDLEAKPTKKTINTVFDGPGEFRVSGRCDGWGAHDFVVVCEIHKTTNNGDSNSCCTSLGEKIEATMGSGGDKETVLIGSAEEVTWEEDDKKTESKKNRARRWSLGARKKK